MSGSDLRLQGKEAVARGRSPTEPQRPIGHHAPRVTNNIRLGRHEHRWYFYEDLSRLR